MRKAVTAILIVDKAITFQVNVKRFESVKIYCLGYADIAQLVEQAPCKRQVVGSNPTVGTSQIAGIV